ncbi:MAG TPA: hypothetical protein VGD27_02810 [Longimicrobiales bacterium]
MKVLWSVILLFAVSLGICTVYFFGHGLSVHDKAKWFGLSVACLVASVALFYSVVKFDRHTPDATHH